MLVKVALPAVALRRNNVRPKSALLVKDVLLPAVALLVNIISARDEPELAVTKFCLFPELFVMPVPLMYSKNEGFTVMVNALAPELNMIWPTSALLESSETEVVFDRSNVATSDNPFPPG